MNLLAKRLGVDVEYVTGPSWNAFLDMIRAKELDVMLNIIKTPEREKYIAFTRPYVENPPVIIARAESRKIRALKNLYGRTVAIPEGFFYQEIIERDHPQISLKLLDSQAEALIAVSLGEADATLGGVAVQTYLIRQNLLTNLNVVGAIKEESFSNRLRIGVRDDWPLLQSIIQKAIDSLSGAEVEALKNQWLAEMEAAAPEIEIAQSTSLSDVIIQLGAITGGLVLLLIALVWGLRRLSARNAENLFQSRQVRMIGMVLVAVFLGALVSAAWVALDRMEQQVRNETGSALRTVVSTSHEALRIWHASHSVAIEEIAGDPQFVALTGRLLRESRRGEKLVASGELAGVRRYFAGLRRNDGESGFTIIAPDQISVAASDNPQIGTMNSIAIQRKEFLDRAFAGETVLVPPVPAELGSNAGAGRGALEASPAMFFAAPIMNAAGDIVAVLALRIDVSDDFTRLMRLGRLGESGETYAFDSAAHLISESRFDDMLRGVGLITPRQKGLLNLNIRDPGGNLIEGHVLSSEPDFLPLTRMAAAALQGESGLDTQGYRDYRGVPVFGAWLWDGELKIGLATEIDVVEAMSSYDSLRNTIAALLGGAMLLGLGLTALSLWMGQSATRALTKARDSLEDRVVERTQELQSSEEALRSGQKRLSLALDAGGMGTWDFDVQSGRNHIDENYAAILGCKLADLENGTYDWQEHLLPEDREQAIADWDEFMAEDVSSLQMEYRIKTFAGTVRWFETRGDIVARGSDDTPARAIGTIVDITDRKAAEETVRKSEEEMRTIYETAAVGITLTTQEGKAIRTNKAYQQMVGRSEEELKTVPFENFTHPDDIDKNLEEFRELLAGRIDGYRMDKRLIHKDGSIILVSTNVTALKNTEGVADSMIATFEDITERKKAEEALRKQTNTIELLHKTASDANQAKAVEDALRSCLDAICAHTEWPVGHVYVRPPGDPDKLVPTKIWHLDDPEGFQAFREVTEKTVFESGVGLPGRVMESGKPAWIVDVTKDPNFPRAEHAMEIGVRAGFAIPVVVGTEVEAVFEFFASEAVSPDEALLDVLNNVSVQVGRVFERIRATAKLADAFGIISSSIDYASTIQRSVLPDEAAFASLLSDHFVLWEPRDVVGGDIYWLRNWGEGYLIIACDCTGHGVPGAFMTLIATGALDNALTEVPSGDVAGLMQRIHQIVQITLGQHEESGESDDGMEVGMCYLNSGATELSFVGARFELYLLEDGEVTTTRGTKSGIGYRGIPHAQEFEQHRIADLAGKTVYMTSDGLIDQVGGEKKRMHGKKRFKALLLSMAGTAMAAQKVRILQSLEEFQGEEIRRDDVLVIGFKA